MFADDAKLFYKHKSISNLFCNLNDELIIISDWFKANKLSVNVVKPMDSLFHKSRRSDDLPLRLTVLKLNENKIERVHSIKFLGILIDEKVSWKQHLRCADRSC